MVIHQYEQVWVELGIILNALIPRLKRLLSRFGMEADSMLPLLRESGYVSDLLEVYKKCIPCEYSENAEVSDSATEDDISDYTDSQPPMKMVDNIPTLNDAIKLIHKKRSYN